ncbi:MAG: hypothetical protein BWY64_02301 [bacterium ADurb.Bin363]|nr:MAG: hypothetical protein BWY64_02301 [bacterium ADurb.Bin363]
MYWYVLFVRTGREHRVEHLLKETLDNNVFMPFVPLLEVVFKKAGVVKKEVKPLFPSYVFIESELLCQQFIKRISTFIHLSSDIIRVLSYCDTEIAMRECEKQMILSLCNNDYCIESSVGIIEGSKIHIIEGPLKGLESVVKKVNRHKRQALIELEFMGDIRVVNVGLDIVEKIPS